MHEPKWRTMVGTLGIIAWIVFYIVVIIQIADHIGGWPFILQMLFYLIAGLAWIFPLRPALRWMETGHLKE